MKRHLTKHLKCHVKYDMTFDIKTNIAYDKTIKQAGAELCQAQAQVGYHAEATTKQNFHLKSGKCLRSMELLPSKFNLVLVIKSCLRPWRSSSIFSKKKQIKLIFFYPYMTSPLNVIKQVKLIPSYTYKCYTASLADFQL